MNWISVADRLPQEGKVLTYSPAYGAHDPQSMKYRLMDAQFVRISTEVSHWCELTDSEPTPGEVPIEKALGKTFAGFAYSHICSQAILRFSDGSYTALGIDRGYEPGDEEIMPKALRPLEWEEHLLVEAGAFTYEELSNLKSAGRADLKARHDAARRRTYEELKREFEP